MVASKLISPNHNLHVVEVAGRTFLLGTAQQSVALLAELDSAGFTEKKPTAGEADLGSVPGSVPVTIPVRGARFAEIFGGIRGKAQLR